MKDVEVEAWPLALVLKYRTSDGVGESRFGCKTVGFC